MDRSYKNLDLQTYVEEVSLEFFKEDFKHKAVWNNRLRTTGGRFFPKDSHLDFNPRIYDSFDDQVFLGIVKHELTHYHLYQRGLAYNHKSQAFKSLLKEVKGLRFTPSLEEDFKCLYRCSKCDLIYKRRRLINISKYRCGRCAGKLIKVKEIK